MYHTLSLALRMLTLVVGLALLIPATSYGADRDVNIRWNPSPSEGVTHYVLGVGVGAGTYLSQITMTDPTIDGDVWSRVVPLDDSADQYLALRAADGGGLYSIYSNEIVVASDDPNPEPNFGVTSLEGIPDPASGEIFVEALVDAGTESVEFLLDDSFFRIENSAPYGFNGDNGPGALIGWDTNTVADGPHAISATGYSLDNAAGEVGRTVNQTFQVHNAPLPLGKPGKPTLVAE